MSFSRNINSRQNQPSNDGGLKPSWLIVLLALVVGLVIPDKINPVVLLFNKDKDKDKKPEGGGEPTK